ncbi:hypothetical protein BN1723_020603 [Verticillium longisporum]|uniref:Uncharacterized protein n=1 Tax=Verticillium longisporum TaxID=100787 RepID=A0A0G4NQ08_VERLO|nr:hypothetical protein BN1723_020603 [Verticillium longisporum]
MAKLNRENPCHWQQGHSVPEPHYPERTALDEARPDQLADPRRPL